MRWSIIKLLLRKELSNAARDRRTFWLTLLMPLFVPILFMLIVPVGTGLVVSQAKPDLLKIAVQGELGAFRNQLEGPGNLLAITGFKPISIVAVENAEQAVRDKKFAVAIVMPARLPQNLDEVTTEIRLYRDGSQSRARTAELYVHAAVERFNQALLQQKLRANDISQRDVLNLQSIDLAQKDTAIGQMALSLVLPLLTLAWAMAGAQPVAIDAAVAERERCTFETLLVAPITRLDVLLGKYLATLTVSVLSAVSGLLGFGLLYLVATQVMKSSLGSIASSAIEQIIGPVQLTVGMGFALTLSTLALAAALSALALLPGFFARTYKEAQMYLLPCMLGAMALMLPAFAADFLGLGKLVACIPISGVVASMMRDLAGQTDVFLSVLGLLSAQGFVVLALVLMHNILNRESVVFRD